MQLGAQPLQLITILLAAKCALEQRHEAPRHPLELGIGGQGGAYEIEARGDQRLLSRHPRGYLGSCSGCW